jgi:MFS family permease
MNTPSRNERQLSGDASYEFRIVTLLALGFGLVGVDRCIVNPLFPAMMRDLHLDYQDIGNAAGALGVAWGIFSIVAGGLSDHFGRRRVLLPGIIGFSLLSGLSGVVTGLASLLLIRTLMGITEGAYCPTSFAATTDASKPSRLGFNLGLQQSTFPLFGLALAPIFATQLLRIMSWRWIFVLVAAPGLALAYLLARALREPSAIKARSTVERAPLQDILRHRNVIISMLALLCAMSELFVIGAMVPSYLVDYVHLTTPQMGFVTSAIGFGGWLGQISLPGSSDLVGRKRVAVVGFAAAAVFLFAFTEAGSNPVGLFVLLFATSFFCCGLIGLITGPVAAEAAPRGLIASTVGIIVGSGEIFGGGIAPSIAGSVAQHWGIQHVFTMSLIGLSLGFALCLFMCETAPRMALSRSF